MQPKSIDVGLTFELEIGLRSPRAFAHLMCYSRMGGELMPPSTRYLTGNISVY
jgi:hypothetical protein